MRPKTLILMVAAVGCGLAASYMTSRLLAERNAAQQADEEKVTVLVAKQNLAMGTLLKDPQKYFIEKPFTKGSEPKKAIQSFDELKDQYLNKPLSAEQFVTKEDLYDKTKDGLAGLMPPGTRAVAIRVNAESIAGGFVQPNSRVDVVHTVRQGDGNSYSQIILQNMLVLAVDTNFIRDPEKPAMLASTVTLAAKPEDAQKLTLAGAMGELRLVLRGYGDEEVVKVRAVKPSDVAKASNTSASPTSEEETAGDGTTPWSGKVPDVPPPAPVVTPEKAPEVPAPKPPKTHTLVIHNGESVTKAVFVLGDEEGEVNTKIEKSHPDREPAPRQPEKTADEPAPAASPAPTQNPTDS